jgi:hypothetical protein
MTQIGQRSLDSPIPPTAVFSRQAHHQILDLRRFSRSATSPFATAIIFLRESAGDARPAGFSGVTIVATSLRSLLPNPLALAARGELARAAGAKIQTIRLYEGEKLLPAPPRTLSGYLDYSQHSSGRHTLHPRNHEIGLTLAEFNQLLDLLPWRLHRARCTPG